MFDIGASELILIVIVAVIFIGPKDMPMALRTVGRWIGKMRDVSNHFRTGLDAMVREAELEDMERKWREQNAAIMSVSPQLPTTGSDAKDVQVSSSQGGEAEHEAVVTSGSARQAEPLPSPPS